MTCAVKSRFHVGNGCNKCLKCYSAINGFDNQEFYIGGSTEEILKSKPVQSSWSIFRASCTPVQTAGVGSANALRCLGAIAQTVTAEEDSQTQRRSKTVFCRECSMVTDAKGSPRKCSNCKGELEVAHRIDLAKLKTISKESVGVCLNCLIRIKQRIPLGKCPRCENAIHGFDDDKYYVRMDTEEMFVRVVVSGKSFAKKLLIGAGVGAISGAGVVGLGGAALYLIGFTSIGITAGSLAASMMSAAAIASGGGVVAGGVIATLQSMGAVGLGVSAYAAGAGAGAAAATGAAAGASSGLKKKAICSACQKIFEILRGTNTCPTCKGQTQDLMEKVNVMKFPLHHFPKL